MLKKDYVYCLLWTPSQSKHRKLSFYSTAYRGADPSTQLHTHPQMPREVLNFRKGSKNFIWYQSDQDVKLSLIGITLAVLTAVFGGDSRPRPWTPVLVMSNKKTKSLLGGINDPGSRGSRLGKLYRKLCLHILFILNICMNSGKQSNNNKALIFQPKSPFSTLRV